MNMISTGAFLTEIDASNKQSELVKTLTAAWEKKNTKVARAGGVSLMALSLAACGSDDDTPFSQVDVDAAKAAATTAALTGADGTVHATVDAAVTSNDTAITAAALTGADGTVHATVDAAVTSNDTVIADAVDKTTDNATATDAAVAADTSFSSLSQLVAAYNAIANPAGSTEALTTSADILIGTTSNDSFTGTTATYAAGDVVSDGSTTDNDSFTLTVTDDINITGSIVNVENVNVNLAQFTNADFDVDVGGISDGTTINFDVTQTGSTVTALSVDSVGSVTLALSDDFTTLDIDADANADVTITSAYTGAGTLVISDSGTRTIDTMTVTTADDVTFNLTNTNVDETLTVTSANDILITAVDAADSLVLTSGDETIITTADDAETITISALGTGLSATGAASTATTASQLNGATDLTTLNLSGNGGAMYIDIAGAAATSMTVINATGEHDVTVQADSGDFDTLATRLDFNDNSTGTTRVVFDTKPDANLLNTTTIGADEIRLNADFGSDVVTIASGQHFVASNNQNTGSQFTAALATASSNTITYEVSDELTTTAGATAATYDIDDITFTNFATVNLIASDNFALQSNAGTPLVGNLTAGTAAIKVTGSGAFTNLETGQITAASIDASEMTGAATLFLDGTTVSNVTTGAGADTLTLDVAAAAGFTLTTGAGADTVELEDTDTSVTIDGGAGTDTVQMEASINLTGQTFALTNVDILDLDSAGAVNTLTVDSGDISGDSYAVKSSNGVDTLSVTADSATVDLSGLTVDAATVTMVINADTFTAVSAVNITGTNDADDIDMAGGVGSTASGAGGVDNILGGAGADTIDGGAGGDTLGGAGGADTITGGEGGDTITSGNGNDTIILTETVAATDTLITSGGAAGTAMSHDTVTGFTAGSAGTADEVDIDVSNIEALATNLSDWQVATGNTGAGNATTTTVTAAFDAANLTAGTDLLVIGGGLTFSSVGAVADALEDGGSVEITINGADTAGDIYMVLYSDGSNTQLAAIETSVAAGDNGTFAAGELSGNSVMTFTGISDVGDFAATNFDFIA